MDAITPDMLIRDVLSRFIAGTQGTRRVRLYCTLTSTADPGRLSGIQLVVTVTWLESRPSMFAFT